MGNGLIDWYKRLLVIVLSAITLIYLTQNIGNYSEEFRALEEIKLQLERQNAQLLQQSTQFQHLFLSLGISPYSSRTPSFHAPPAYTLESPPSPPSVSPATFPPEPDPRADPSESSPHLIPAPAVIEEAGLILDLNDLPELTGPFEHPIDTTAKQLIVMCIGESDKENVNDLMIHFLNRPRKFTFMLFHYDYSVWNEFPWYNRVNVVAIRIAHKMKWWYIKRFVTPSIARAFSHVIILDADVGFHPPFELLKYIQVADVFDLALSQPAHLKQTSTHENVWRVEGPHVGRYTDFIECGPAVVFTSKAYQCVYNIFQVDLTSGWGLDYLWVPYLRDFCGYGLKSAAVIDKFALLHSTPTGEGTASSLPEFNTRAANEMYTYFDRFPDLVEKYDPNYNETFGYGPCITEPESCRDYL